MEKYSSEVPTTDPTRHPFFARRPKSSPSLRSNSTVNERPQAGPSYQQRRLQRHGSTKFSRPTTAVLRQHSQDLLYHNNGGQKLFRSKSFINSHQSSAPSSSRIEAWDVKDTKTPSTTVDSKPALLRPHTAVLLRRRLRHIVKNRIKSAHPAVESNSVVSGYSDVEEEAQFGTRIIDLEKRAVNVLSANETGVSKQNTSASNDTGAAAGTFEESPAVATSKQSDGDAPTTIIGWGSSKSKSVHAFTDVSEKLLKRPVPKTSNENDDDLHQLSGNKQASQYDGEGSTAAHTGVVESKSPPTLTITQSNTPSNELSPSAAAPLSTGEQNHHEILQRSLRKDHDKQSFQAIGSPAESSRSSTPPSKSSPDNTDEYVPAAPELRLGYAEYSIPLTTSDLGKSHSKSAQNQAHHRKASVVSMMKRNRHSRHNRLSVYLKTATTRTGESALDKFRRLCKTIRVIAGICIALKSYVKEGKTKQWSLVEMQLNLKADMEKALTFDPLMFSNLHVSRGSHKLKIILSKLPKHRTQRDVDVVVALLRKNRTFANCHRDTQLELAKVMEYQRFEPRRIVLKEGHAASCYYIILSGVCLVNQLDFDRRNNSQFVTTVKEIGPGDCFGEVALLTDSVRECSIICKEEVELLLVNKDDFMSIIRIPMENEQKELVKYCVLRSVFTDEMFGNIKSTYKTTFRHYYKPGTVISKDLNKDEYIYVIKVGNCRVLSEVLEPRKKKESASKSMSDDSWKKKAALKRSMSLLGGSKRRVGWAEYAKKKIEKGGGQLPNKHSPTARGGADSTIKTDFNAIPASEYLAAHVALQKETKVADKKAVARAWRRVTTAAISSSEQEMKKEEEKEIKTAVNKNMKATFAQVADLTSGAVCGLETILNTLRPDTRLSLVSDGVDCILVSKKIFNSSKNTAKTVETVNKMATEYPPSSDQLAKLVQARTWAAYKDKLVGGIIYDRNASSKQYRGKAL